MDEALVRKRCLELSSSVNDNVDYGCIVYRAAYADGMEAGAKIGESVADLLYSSSPSHRKGCATVVDAIRQHAKEMGHE